VRTIVGYEGEGRRRRPVWSDSVPGFAAHSHRPSGQLVTGQSDRERRRQEQRAYKARKAAAA
jgi:hypothetical protein